MKRKVLVTCVMASLIGTSGIASANDAARDSTLVTVRTAVNNLKESLEKYYGVKTSSPTSTYPSKFAVPDFSNARDDRNRLASFGIQGGRSFNTVRVVVNKPNGAITQADVNNNSSASMTLSDISNMLNTPRPSDCETCTVNTDSGRQGTMLASSLLPFKKLDSGDEVLDKDRANSLRNSPGSYKALDIESLLGPTAYAASSVTTLQPTGFPGINSSVTSQLYGKDAVGFISHVTDGARDFRLAKKLPPADSTNKYGQNMRARYLAKLSAYVATYSTGMSNLNQMYSSRVPSAALQNKSKMQIENGMVMRRMKKSWQDDMNKATQLVVQREILFALADLNYQLYQQRLLTERLLATESINLIQGSLMQKSQVDYKE